jgi:arginine utilization regulatory protein
VNTTIPITDRGEIIGALEVSRDISVILDPSKLLESGKLKQDLFFRLSVIYVEIPPLRERREDIYDLVYYFIKKYNEKFNKNVSGIQEDVIDIFQEYTWPGNVRELEHVIEALMNYVDEGQIKREHLRFLSFGAFKNYIEKETPVFTGVQFKKRIFDYEKNLVRSMGVPDTTTSQSIRLMVSSSSCICFST